MILPDAFILPLSQLQVQQVMTSQIRSHVEYLMMISYSGLLFWATLYSKTVFIAQTFKLITFFKITKAPLYNNIVCLMNVTKEMHHVFINNMSKI